jgi:uncharacterized protein (DUF1800 family)
MQLFTLGLIRLNIDGTPMRGADGQPIETYSNVDLTSYARAWTGLDETPSRGNNDGFRGRLDPMRVSPCVHQNCPEYQSTIENRPLTCRTSLLRW